MGLYRLVKLLGTGGMGTVFLAEHHSIGRKVAIKFLLPELSQYPDLVGRFFDEARAVNRINHENIVEVFDFVTSAQGLSYLVMELLDGLDLYQTRKREGPYPLGRALVTCEQIASALSAAHQVGIVHRDLKPENVFLLRRRKHVDFVKLLDFGLAKLSEDLPVSRLPTQAGIVMGTPGYMSPEQARGLPVDGRSDVFSLGALLHWMLVDRVPSGANSACPTANVNGEEVPDQLQALVAHCLMADPARRPASMNEVLESLTDLRRQVRGTEVLRVMPRSESLSQPPMPAAASRGEAPRPASPAAPPESPSRFWQAVVLGAACTVLLVTATTWWVVASRNRNLDEAGPARVTGASGGSSAKTASTEATPGWTPPPATELPALPPPPPAAPLRRGESSEAREAAEANVGPRNRSHPVLPRRRSKHGAEARLASHPANGQ